MTTPAVDLDTVIPLPCYEIHTFPDGSSSRTDFGPASMSRASRHRPASVSNPADPINGWRSPGDFYHRGYQLGMPTGSIHWDWYKGNPSFGVHFEEVNYPWSGVFANPPDLPSNEVYSRAIDSLLSKIKSQKVNLGQMILEAGETSELIVSTINKVTTLTKAFRSKSPKAFLWAKTIGNSPGHRGSKAPDAYLEYVYGYKPLVQDAYGILDELNNRGRSKPPAFNATGRSRVKDSGLRKISSTYDAQNTFDVQWERSEQVIARVDLELTNGFVATLSSLGILNPVALAWERLPFSFVADWFVPVGNWLGNLDAGLGYAFKGGSISYISKRTERSTHFTPRPDAFPATDYRWEGSGYSYSGFNFKREKLFSLPLGTVYLKNPFPKNGIHIANAIALLVGALR